MNDLVCAQKKALERIFAFGTSTDEEDPDFQVGSGCTVPRALFTFKALIYDSHAQSIIAPVMKIGHLRDCNVVFHANLGTKREPIPDLPCIYLVEPTSQNYRAIA